MLLLSAAALSGLSRGPLGVILEGPSDPRTPPGRPGSLHFNWWNRKEHGAQGNNHLPSWGPPGLSRGARSMISFLSLRPPAPSSVSPEIPILPYTLGGDSVSPEIPVI